MYVTVSNFKDVVNNRIAFNGVTGSIFKASEQERFAEACKVNGYTKNVWSTVSGWRSLHLSVKGAKGKSVKVMRFLSPSSKTPEEQKAYQKALAAYLKLKGVQVSSKGKKGGFNPYHFNEKTKVITHICYYFNIEEVRAFKGAGTQDVEIVIPDVVTAAASSLALPAPAQSVDAIEYLADSEAEEKAEDIEEMEAEVITEEKAENATQSVADDDGLAEMTKRIERQLWILKRLAVLRAEVKSLTEELNNLQSK